MILYNANGTITLVSESNKTLTQTLAAGSTQAQVDSAAASFFPVADYQAAKQAQLDALFDIKFDLAKFIRAGTATTVTAANVGTFLSQITNNYRTLRASIAAAASVAAVNAIDVTAGWPSNP